MQQIERGIYYENSFLGVTLGGLIFPHGTIFIDAPLRAEDTRSWRSVLLNQRGGANRLLVNLDAHPDRTLGARALDCTIVAHQKTTLAFRNRPSIFKGQTVETGSVWELYPDAVGMRWASPDITFSDRMSLHWGGPEIILEHHPGPMQGSIWVIIPSEKIVFVGDTVVVEQPPFLASGELPEWVESLDLLLSSYGDYTLISGRGGPFTLEAVSKQRQLILDVIQAIEGLAERNAAPEDTEGFIPKFLAQYPSPAELREKYTQRLRYGLYQVYARRYRPTSSLEQLRIEESEP